MTVAVAVIADTIAPGPGLIVWTLLALCVVSAGVVTAMKGRWGWFWASLLFGGLPWLVSAFLPAHAGSLWARRA
ncbi:MAG TPA: hypothetical protein VGW10_16155 [Solirubrobacteraceae bacterium]|nr:hypothetical protein [Solirubrobacteraceae bacterium]